VSISVATWMLGKVKTSQQIRMGKSLNIPNRTILLFHTDKDHAYVFQNIYLRKCQESEYWIVLLK